MALAQNNEGFLLINEHLSKHLHAHQPFDAQAPDWNHVWVIYPFAAYKGQSLKPNEFIGVSTEDLRHLPVSPYRNMIGKMVIQQQTSFADKRAFNMHRLLRAVHQNTLLSKLSHTEHAKGTERMIHRDELLKLFEQYPHLIANTNRILESCDVEFTYGKLANKNKQFYLHDAAEDLALLRSECEKGLLYRFGRTTW